MPKNRFTEKEKRDALLLIRAGASTASVSKKTGISQSLLYKLRAEDDALLIKVEAINESKKHDAFITRPIIEDDGEAIALTKEEFKCKYDLLYLLALINIAVGVFIAYKIW